MASTGRRKAAGLPVVTSKPRPRPSTPLSPRRSAVPAELDGPGGRAARAPGPHELEMRAFEIYLARGEWPGRDIDDIGLEARQGSPRN
jgi:hypothetical protein